MLLKQIKTESYGMIRHNSLHPSLSAKNVKLLLGVFCFDMTR